MTCQSVCTVHMWDGVCMKGADIKHEQFFGYLPHFQIQGAQQSIFSTTTKFAHFQLMLALPVK